MANILTLRSVISPYGDFTKGSVLSHQELDNNFITLKGNSIYSAQTSGNTVILRKYNGEDLSFNVGSGSGMNNQWFIPANETVSIDSNYQGFIYGDVFIEGTLNVELNSKFVVINGQVNLVGGGSITGDGDIYVIDLPTFDTHVTGGTYNSISGEITFTNNSGNTFSVTGITSGGSGSTGPISVSGTTLYSNNPTTSGFSTNGNIFFGTSAGSNSINTNDSIFMGLSSGLNASGSSQSVFIGRTSGQNAYDSSSSVFIGNGAGINSYGSFNSVILGDGSGFNSFNIIQSNIIGKNASLNGNNIINSNIIGTGAGRNSSGCSGVNFFGISSGDMANNVNNSNFIGLGSGSGATASNNSNFIGQYVGTGLTNSNYSNLFGYKVGCSFPGNNIGSNNIIIGTNISLPNGTENGINIGGVLFGSGTYFGGGGPTPLIGASENGRIGIQVVIPSSTLDVSGVTGYNQFRIRTSYTPTSSGDTNGNIGDVAWDNQYIYIKTNTGWGRTQLDYGF
jgi:hypothetical protein